MTGPANPGDDFDPIDDLVREHVEREVDSVDPAAMLARVRAARQAERPRRRGWVLLASGLVAGIGIGAAATILLLVHTDSPSSGTRLSEARAATPAELVQRVFVAHSDDTDRLYEVKVEPGDGALISRKYPFLSAPAHFWLIQDSKLWVRGNQFWIEPGAGTRPMCWGRDRDGRLWFMLNQRTGLQYARAEDENVTRLCNLMSLRVPMLAAEMLDGYELSTGESAGPGSPIRVVGVIRQNPNDIAISRVTLELDPQTKVIRKAIQRRTIGPDHLGTFTYTLVQTGRIPDSRYELLGHLDPGGRVLDARDKKGRNDMFNRFPGWKKP